MVHAKFQDHGTSCSEGEDLKSFGHIYRYVHADHLCHVTNIFLLTLSVELKSPIIQDRRTSGSGEKYIFEGFYHVLA